MNPPIDYDTEWQSRYADMLATPEMAVSRIKPGQRVFIGTGCGEPVELVRAMTANAPKLADVEIVHLLTKGKAPYADRKYAYAFKVNSFFIGTNIRNYIQEGLGDYTPMPLSSIPSLFRRGQLPLDVVMIQTTPPDKRGKVSLGISVDIVKSAAENGSLVIALINPNMPWTLGDSTVDVLDMDVLVPCDQPLIARPQTPIDDETRKIGEHIAALVENGSTIEFGIGRIPQALVEFLTDKKDLGIHTEMLTDSIVDLVKSGAVNGKRKTKDRGKVVASFCMGTRKLYDFIDNNPTFAFRPTEYVNDSFIIGKQHKMVAINMALQIDLTGQVCSDSLGTRFYSGIGGQVDFNRGAALSEGGKPIIAIPATAVNGTISRIVTRLSDGAGVVTTRGDVHYVVTEFGTAYLHGKCIQERVLALISIAHPKFRDQLLTEAIAAQYLPAEFADVGGKLIFSSQEMKTSYLLEDGVQINFRPIHPTDEHAMRDLLYTLSQETVYYRFMSQYKSFTHKQIRNFVYIDHRRDVALVGVLSEAHGEDIVAVGRYYLDEQTNMAEIAFVIHDGWQNKGIGKFLFQHLQNIAIRSGIAGFTAEVLRENKRMQTIFNHSDCRVKSRLEDDVYSYEIEFGKR